ncbi:mannosyl-oligosaccharide 1,2-alpha-mannosidase IA isoform X1 [Tachysurus ichikawai]
MPAWAKNSLDCQTIAGNASESFVFGLASEQDFRRNESWYLPALRLITVIAQQHSDFTVLAGCSLRLSSFFTGSLRGATIVDALDTLYIMEMYDEFEAATEWVEKNLDFNMTLQSETRPKLCYFLFTLLSNNCWCSVETASLIVRKTSYMLREEPVSL